MKDNLAAPESRHLFETLKRDTSLVARVEGQIEHLIMGWF